MPKFNPNVKEAQDFAVVPGTWLVKIPRVAKMGETSKPGIEIGASNKKHEMWKCIVEIVDKGEKAPTNAHFFENLTWDGGAGESRIQALLRHLGYPVDEWRKNPGNVDITPDMLYERPFTMRVKVRYYERETKQKTMEWAKSLESDGFQPFGPASAPTGPVPDTTPVPTTPPMKKGAGGAAAGSAAFPHGANAAPGAPGAKPGDEFGWG